MQAMGKFYESNIEALPPLVVVQLRTGGGQLLGEFTFRDSTIAQASQKLRFIVCKQKNIPELCVFLEWTQRHNSGIEVKFRPKEIDALAQDYIDDFYWCSSLCRGGPGMDGPCDVCCSAVTNNAKKCSQCKETICSSCCVEVFDTSDDTSDPGTPIEACFNCAYRHCRHGQGVLNPARISIPLLRRMFLLGFINLSGNGCSIGNLEICPRFGGTWKSYATAVCPKRPQEVCNRSKKRKHS